MASAVSYMDYVWLVLKLFVAVLMAMLRFFLLSFSWQSKLKCLCSNLPTSP